MKRYTKGFTLIELLVVIAIIGILSSVVLVSLSSARNKGNDAKIQQQLSSIRSAAELYATSNNESYGPAQSTGVCTGGMFIDSASGIGNLLAAITTTKMCNSSTNAYVVAAALTTTGQYWCVDSRGISRGKNAAGNAYGSLVAGTNPALSAVSATSCN